MNQEIRKEASTMDFQDSVVVITRTEGFIGSHLTEALPKTRARVRAMFRYNSYNCWGFLEPCRKESLEISQ